MVAEARTGTRHLTTPAMRAAMASPFDYGEATRVLIVRDVRREDADQVAAAYRELFLASGGGALGLFTAIGRLRAVHQRIAAALEEAGLPLYAQHVEGMDAATLVDIFRAEEHSCLLGTDAVRDGVDVPGRSLRLIVFDRVPWPRPDILHRARKACWKKMGAAATAYDDMLARLRLKQAYGRLIRRADDRGVFVVLELAPAQPPARRLPSRGQNRARWDCRGRRQSARVHGVSNRPERAWLTTFVTVRFTMGPRFRATSCGVGESRKANMWRLLWAWQTVLIAALWLIPAIGRAAEPTPLSVPILLYHRLGPVAADEMTVTTPVVEAQLKEMQEGGYSVIPLTTLLAALADPSMSLPDRPIVIVADDGNESVYSDLFPLMKRFGIPVTLFIYPSAISNANYAMTWQQLAEIKASGLADIQSHTYWHPNFNIEKKRLAPEAYEKFVHDQLVRSKAVLEHKLGGKVDLLAWPFGIHDADLERAAQVAGYVAAFTIDRRPVRRADKMMALPRFIVTNYDRSSRLASLLQGSSR